MKARIASSVIALALLAGCSGMTMTVDDKPFPPEVSYTQSATKMASDAPPK